MTFLVAVGLMALSPKDTAAYIDYITTISNGTLVKPLDIDTQKSEEEPILLSQTKASLDRELLRAVKDGNISNVRALLRKGANVNSVDDYDHATCINDCDIQRVR